MPEILLTPELLESEAAKLLGWKNELDAAFNKIQTLISGLINNWHGEAQQAFESSYESKKPTITQLTQDMEKFANFMKSYAEHMRDSERGSAQRAASL